MEKPLFKNSNTFSKLLQLIFATFFTSLVAIILIRLIGVNSQNISALKISQLILSVFTFLLPPVVCGFFWYESPVQSYGLNKLPSLKIILLVILLMIFVSPFINLLSYLNEQMAMPSFLKGMESYFKNMEDSAAQLTGQMLNVTTINGLMMNLLVMAVVPALGEELFFRGSLLNVFSENGKNKHIAVWVVAIIFSLVHFQMYGFIPRMILGALLGYLIVWSKSLWLPIIAHFINNAMAVLVSFFGRNNTDVKALEDIGKASTYVYGIFSLIISLFLFSMIYFLLNQSKKRTSLDD